MNADNDTGAVQSYKDALHEVQRNLEVRRLMLVVVNLLVPALAMAMADCLSGADYPPQVAWLPRHIVAIVGLTLAVAGTLVTCILTRCHFGLLVNGSRMRHVLTGRHTSKPFDWLGVTTNFTALTSLSAGAGLSLLVGSLGPPLLAAILGPLLVILLMLHLRLTHWGAHLRCEKLAESWETGAVPRSLQEKHSQFSLNATASDISVVVTMAVALFVGSFNAMTNVGGIPDQLDVDVPTYVLKKWGIVALSSYTLLSVLLSARMVVRLRLALAEHAWTLAGIRGESSDAYHFRPGERTFLLFLLLQLVASAAALMLAWTLGGRGAGIAAGGVVLVTGIVGYPTRLSCARRQRVQQEASDPCAPRRRASVMSTSVQH